VILMHVSSTTFQILSSLKTVFTGILFRVVLKRILSDVQATSILILACGAAVSQFPLVGSTMPSPLPVNDCAPAQGDSDGAIWHAAVVLAMNASVTANVSAANTSAGNMSRLSDGSSSSDGSGIGGVGSGLLSGGNGALIGAFVALITCFLSALGGIYSELLLKRDGQLHSIHLQNSMLYSWGVLFNATALFFKDRERIESGGLLQGYTPIVLVLILNNACVGLAISAILKFANNLVRVFAHTAAMLLTMVLEVALMGAHLSPQLVTSIVIVSSSTYLYNLHPPPRPAKQVAEPIATTSDTSSATDKEPLSMPNAIDSTARIDEDDEDGGGTPRPRTVL